MADKETTEIRKLFCPGCKGVMRKPKDAGEGVFKCCSCGLVSLMLIIRKGKEQVEPDYDI